MDRFVDHMKQCQTNLNTELAHIDADYILVEFIRELGYNDLADAYETVKKWYS